MKNETKPKWDIDSAIKAGDEAYSLLEKYFTFLEKRLKPEELTDFKTKLDELRKRPPVQTTNLVVQKSKTEGQDDIMKSLRTEIVSIRNVIKSGNASDEISKAFGVGEKLNNSITSCIAGANLVITAFDTYKEWCIKEAGLLEEDMDVVSSLITELETAAGIQDSAMSNRKGGTLDKNLLQRQVEDEITRISALGAHALKKTNSAVAALFENLVPGNPKPKPQAAVNGAEAK